MTEPRIPMTITCQKTERHNPHARLWMGFWLECPGDHPDEPDPIAAAVQETLDRVDDPLEELHAVQDFYTEINEAVRRHLERQGVDHHHLNHHELISALDDPIETGDEAAQGQLAEAVATAAKYGPWATLTKDEAEQLLRQAATKYGPAVPVTLDLIEQAKAEAPHSPEEMREAHQEVARLIAKYTPGPEAPLEGAQSAPEAMRDKMWREYRVKRWQALRDVLDAQHEGALSVNARNSLANALEQAMTAFSKDGADLLFNQALERGTKLGHQVEDLTQEVARLGRINKDLNDLASTLDSARLALVAELRETRVEKVQAGLAQKTAEAEAQHQRGAKAKWKRKAGDLARSVQHWMDEHNQEEIARDAAEVKLARLRTAAVNLALQAERTSELWEDRDETGRALLRVALATKADDLRAVIEEVSE